MKSRLGANLEIIERLEAYVKEYPDIRFHQALYNLGILRTTYVEPEVKVTNDYHEEPATTLSRVNHVVGKDEGG